jgi:hypothetical protein
MVFISQNGFQLKYKFSAVSRLDKLLQKPRTGYDLLLKNAFETPLLFSLASYLF